MIRQRLRSRYASRLLGVSALGSGAALVAHIVSGVSLRLALVLTSALLMFVIGSLWRRVALSERSRLIRSLKTGLISGSFATVSYDTTKFALSQWNPSPYNPFEVIRVFGILLVGSATPEAIVYSAGTAFHLVNGISFGIAFCLLFGHHGIGAGIAWGIFLEVFQLTLYPGWLDIRFYQEFVQISALGHLVYGAVLGFSCRYFLQETKRKGLP